MLSRTAIHTLKAVTWLAADPEQRFRGTGEIAKATGAPSNYLGKLLQSLAREGVLVSQKGMGGGFKLARAPHEITLFDVVEPIDNVSRFKICLLGGQKCSDANPCALHTRWGELRANYLGVLNEFTLADLVKHG